MAKLGKSLEVAFSSDGAWLALVAERYVRVVAASDLKERCRVKARNPSHVRFAGAAGLVIKTTSGRLSWHDLDGKTSRALRGDSEEGPAPVFVDDERLVDASWSGRLEVVELDSGRSRQLAAFAHGARALHHVREQGTWLLQHCPLPESDDVPPGPDYFSCFRGDYPGGEARRVEPGLGFVKGSAVHPAGELLALVHGAPPDHLSLVDLASGTPRATIAIAYGGTGSELAWSPDGRWLAVIEDHACRIYDERLALQQEHSVKYASSLSFAPDQSCLAIGSWQDGAIVQLALP